ncbi:hypothetical protein PsorP6_002947 [Peronosclerospora sorghi]|uniref:Uncharacterized protein n=1 Tax=Peronosclerospora sorghi TaxID=230839 RepID=A0ACC0VNL9_9STRA|nr:hypothetical protein PsorP6_002947 [Peronosclerospora sorghi]
MEALSVYASSDDDEQRVPSASCAARPVLNSAPRVPLADAHELDAKTAWLRASAAPYVTQNLPVETGTLAPVVGPQGCAATSSLARMDAMRAGSGKELVTGIVEPAAMHDDSFDTAYHGMNQQLCGTSIVRTRVQGAPPCAPALPGEEDVGERSARSVESGKHKRRKTAADMDVGDESTSGIWAPYTRKDVWQTDAEQGTLSAAQQEQREAYEATQRSKTRAAPRTDVDEQLDFDRLVEKKTAHLLPARLKAGATARHGTSTFCGEHEFDYQGRAWSDPPRGLKPDDGDHRVFLPKRCVHKWVGHRKGVQAIELFPKVGHLLLSASLDHTVRIWDVYRTQTCQRVYEGHAAAVRAINFSPDGRHFLSCSYDRFIQLWDTETGQATQSFTTRRVPYCLQFYPLDATQFIVGDSNHMIVQFDTRSGGGGRVQEYNHHLQAVNSVTFVDDARRFVSTSDDKKVLVWEWGLPVPIKYIAEPSMHSMPAVTLHPSGHFFAGQAMNNQIDVYTARDKFKLVRTKTFRGHQTAGYACQLGFAPNGQYLVSGDGDGKLVFWDWKTTKMVRTVHAHDRGPTMGALWHPLEPSKVVSCGWDGVIKYWD